MAVAKTPLPMSYWQIPLGILLAFAVLYFAKVIILPLVLALLVAFVLTPIVVALQRVGIRRGYGVVITVLFAFSLFGVVAYVVGSQVHSLASGLPNHRKEIEAKIATLREESGTFANLMQMYREISKGEGDTNLPSGNGAAAKNVIVTRPEEASSAEKIFQTVFPILEPLARSGFVVILVIFMLFRREDLRNRFIGLLGDGRLTGTTRVIVDSAQRLSRFLLTQLLINIGFGTMFAIGLYFMNVDYALLWGVLMALMRFVPYIGVWIAVLLPVALSFATAPNWTQPVGLVAYFGVLDLLTAYAVEPLLLGHRTGVSPIALLVAAAFWTWLWGPMGLVLSTPLTVCMVVIGQHVPRLRFFSLLLSDQPPLAPKVRYYQRLLARDEIEAKDVVVEYAKSEGLDKAYDNVLLPALALARQDRKDAGLETEDEEFIIDKTREILAGLKAKPPIKKPAATETGAVVDELRPSLLLPGGQRVLVLGCPAHHKAEELALQMLANMLRPDGCDVEIVSTKALPAEIEALIAERLPTFVFIGVVPPGGLVQARFLCRRLRRKFAALSILVGYLGPVHDFDRLFRQVRSAGGNYVATSLLQARSQIAALIHAAPVSESHAAMQEA